MKKPQIHFTASGVNFLKTGDTILIYEIKSFESIKKPQLSPGFSSSKELNELTNRDFINNVLTNELHRNNEKLSIVVTTQL